MSRHRAQPVGVFLFIVVTSLIVGCVRPPSYAESRDCVYPQGATWSRAQRLATSRTMPSDFGELVVTVAAGDSSGRALEGAAIGLVLLDAPRQGAVDRLAMRPTNIGGLSKATLAAGRAALAARRIGYETHRDTVMVRAGYSDTLTLRLRPRCMYLESSTVP